MGIEERLQVLEEEHQLVRGELKQTLVNVRDFLLELNLPALQEEEEREIHEHNETHNGEDGSRNAPEKPAPTSAPSAPAPAAPAPFSSPPTPQPVGQSAPSSISMVNKIGGDGSPPPVSSLASDDFSYGDEILSPEDEILPLEAPAPEEPSEDIDEVPVSPLASQEPAWEPETTEYEEEPDGPVEDPLMYEDDLNDDDEFVEEAESPAPLRKQKDTPDRGRKIKTVAERSSQINLLTNLIRWVTVARKEIGPEYLPAFLDVYGIGDVVSDELRQTILYLSETLGPKPACVPETVPPRQAEIDPEIQPCAEDTGVTGPETPEEPPLRPLPEPNGEVWNRMILELHGILRCSDVTFEESQLPWKRSVAPADMIPETITPDSPPVPVDPVTGPEGPDMPAEDALVPENTADEAEGPEEPEEPEEPETKPKNGRSRKNGRKRPSLPEPVGARLRLVLPVGDDQETEIDIGEFSLNLSRKEVN